MTVTTTGTTGGAVAAGFERVQETFAAGASDLGDGGGAYCVYVGGEKVVDLWAGQARAGQPWEQDTLALLMSTTKGLTALCAQVLHDRGLLDVEAPVSAYWPEFACNGKEKATVRMVLDHTVGVLGLPDPGAFLDWEGNGWDDYDAIADALAAAPAAWEPGTRIGYHAITVGWLTGELVRRVAGVTVGQLLREAVAGPLGVDAFIGTPLDQQHRVATLIPEGYDGIPPEMVEADRTIKALFDDPTSILSTAAIHMHGSNVISSLGTFMNRPRALAAEIAAGNGTAGARDVARVYAMLANGGSLDGVRIVSPESIRSFSAVSFEGRSAITPAITVAGLTFPPPWTVYGLGYARNVPEPGMPPAFGPNTETFGHAGHGGQVGFADPVRNVSVGFVRSHLSLSPLFAASLIAATYDCVA